jgi:hypothetical protein
MNIKFKSPDLTSNSRRCFSIKAKIATKRAAAARITVTTVAEFHVEVCGGK